MKRSPRKKPESTEWRRNRARERARRKRQIERGIIEVTA